MRAVVEAGSTGSDEGFGVQLWSCSTSFTTVSLYFFFFFKYFQLFNYSNIRYILVKDKSFM